MDGWKKRLADLDQEGSPEIRTCVVQATLEHLLEQRHFRKYFSDWKKDPILRMAYEEAFLWIKAAEKLHRESRLSSGRRVLLVSQCLGREDARCRP
jgi:hypothetical protein